MVLSGAAVGSFHFILTLAVYVFVDTCRLGVKLGLLPGLVPTRLNTWEFLTFLF